MKDRIKKIRTDAGLTQQAFAEKLGVKQNTVATYEMGRTAVGEAVIISICREFKVNEQWLRTGEGNPYREKNDSKDISEFLNEVMGDVDETFRRRFIAALSRLNESDWETLEKIANELNRED